MRILIAEDDPVSRCFLEATLLKWGYEVVAVSDGEQAWEALNAKNAPHMAILDWMMPEADGLEICRRLQALRKPDPVYTIMLTARTEIEDVVAGLEAGADDYVTKPFKRQELRARINVGVRMLDLRRSLAHRVEELEQALSRVKQLQGLLPICSYCRKVRDDQNYWQQVEEYVVKHSEVEFSHGICPKCYDRFVEPQIQEFKRTG